MGAGKTGIPDRRVLRTQKLLREALHTLIREKDYDAIVVKEILDRANVGRSAFYTHFKDKDELLVSSIHDLLGVVPGAVGRSARTSADDALWFSLPILAYHEQHRRGGNPMVGKRAQAILHEHLRMVLARLVMQRLRSFDAGRKRGQQRMPAGMPVVLLAEFIAGTFVLVLDWWINARMPVGAEEANGLFRALVLPSLGEP